MTPYYRDERSGITIYHADCREVLPNLEADSIDFVFTDPPFGHTENGSLQQRREAVLGWSDGIGVYRDPRHHSQIIANDGHEANDLIRWSYTEWDRLLKPGCCCCCCCCGGGPDPQFARWSLWLDEAIGFKQMVVWDKGPMGMGWHYRRSYETVLVGEKPGAACRWFDETDKVENIIRHISKIIPQANDHPTPKPLELTNWFMRLHTKPGHIVLDPFCGSGPTLESAKLNGCAAIGCDVDERWLEIAARRLEQGVFNFVE